VIWRCWLGSRKGIRSEKNWVVGCWRGYLSGARCRLAWGKGREEEGKWEEGRASPKNILAQNRSCEECQRRGSWVWTTCPESLRGRALVVSRTRSLTTTRPTRAVIAPPRHPDDDNCEYVSYLFTQRERYDTISVDDVAWLVEESFRTELLRLVPVVGIHVSTVQVHHHLHQQQLVAMPTAARAKLMHFKCERRGFCFTVVVISSARCWYWN